MMKQLLAAKAFFSSRRSSSTLPTRASGSLSRGADDLCATSGGVTGPLSGVDAVDSLSDCCNDHSRVEEEVDVGTTPQNAVVEVVEAQHLPDGVVELIVKQLSTSEPSSLLTLLALCGTCRQWRHVARSLSRDVHVTFCGDFAFTPQPLLQRFRRLTPAAKEVVFASAARLFTGYGQVTLSGDGITNSVLEGVASCSGGLLDIVKIDGCNGVSDPGLKALLKAVPDMESFYLEDVPNVAAGFFLVHLFERCPKLKTVHLSYIPSLNWEPCILSSFRWTELPITKLHVRDVKLDPEFGNLMSKMPHLEELEIDGNARNLRSAAMGCPKLQRLSYLVSSRFHMDEALAALLNMPNLTALELIVKNFMLSPDELRVCGMLNLVELRVDSFMFKQQPTLGRSSYSHLDNDGVKALVDSMCTRWYAVGAELQPLKLSLCGATALTHDAVSALMRLPILTELDIGGCCRIIAMDKMRLVAKVRAGREMLESGRKPAMGSNRFPMLFF